MLQWQIKLLNTDIRQKYPRCFDFLKPKDGSIHVISFEEHTTNYSVYLEKFITEMQRMGYEIIDITMVPFIDVAVSALIVYR